MIEICDWCGNENECEGRLDADFGIYFICIDCIKEAETEALEKIEKAEESCRKGRKKDFDEFIKEMEEKLAVSEEQQKQGLGRPAREFFEERDKRIRKLSKNLKQQHEECLKEEQELLEIESDKLGINQKLESIEQHKNGQCMSIEEAYEKSLEIDDYHDKQWEDYYKNECE